MHDEINQKISQFIDDELPQHKALQLLTEIKKQPELDAKLQRYEMASAILKKHPSISIRADFSEKISQALASEVVYLLPKKRTKSIYYKSAMAVAAGVAGVAIFLANNVPELTDVKQEPFLVANDISNQKTPVEKQEPVEVVLRKSATIDPRFKHYLQAHRGNLYTIDPGVQSYARLAGASQ